MESPEFESPESAVSLQKYWLILKRHWLPAATVLGCVVAGAVVVASVQQPVYEAQGKLLFKKINQANAAAHLSDTSQQVGELTPLNQAANPLNTETEIIRSVPLLQKTIATLNLRDRQGLPLKPQTLAERVKLSNVQLSDILVLSYQSTDPKEAAAVVNQLMQNYVEANRQTNQAAVVAADAFITKQMPAIESTVWQAEAALRQFKEQNHVVALEEEAKSAVVKMGDLDKKIIDTQAALTDTNTRAVRLQTILGMNSQEAIATNALNQSVGVQDALKEYQTVETQLVVEGTRFQPANPAIQTLQDKRTVLKALLQERIAQTVGDRSPVLNGKLQIGVSKQKLSEDLVTTEVQRLGLANQVVALSQAKLGYKQLTNAIPRLEQEQRELTRRSEVARSTYETYLKRLQEVRVTETENLGNVWIIESGSPPETPSNDPKFNILAIGGLLGILLSIATVLVLEARDTSIKNLEEAKDLFGYPLLGSIAYAGKTVRRKHQDGIIPALPVRDTPRSPLSNAYQMLQTNLNFVYSDKALQVIVVTSSVPKEGKSTISANMAVAMAQAGRRVLLIDADMRHPLQHHIWRLTNLTGLSNVIVGETEFNNVVQEVMPRLDVLASGVIPPNPVALLDSKRMATLLETCSKNYDFVIIDTPPLTGVADAAILGKMADGILLVVRPGVVNSGKAKEAKEFIARSGQNVLGLVANGIVMENEPDDSYRDMEQIPTKQAASQQPTATVSVGSSTKRF